MLCLVSSPRTVAVITVCGCVFANSFDSTLDCKGHEGKDLVYSFAGRLARAWHLRNDSVSIS